MKAIVLNAPHDFCLQDIDDPVVSGEELEIQVNLVGICGTDLTMVRGTNPAIQYPIVPGHECMGEVVAAPDGSEFQPGDRVTVFPALGCETCEACLSGRIPHCPEAKTIGVQRPGGYFAERISAHPRRVFKLPDSVADAVGSMVEPTAVAVHANHRGMVDKGSKVVVLGGGTIGLLIAQTALAFGAAGVVVNEPIAERRDLAKNIGISWVCNSLEQDPVAVVRDRISAAPLIGKILPLAGFAEGMQLLEDQPQKYFKIILSPLE